jgi:hypothetical protein
MKKYYIIQVVGDVEPVLHGPYKKESEQDKAAKQLRLENGDADGIYHAKASKTGKLSVGSYTALFFEDGD